MQMTMGREESPKNVRTHIVNKGQEQGAVGEWAWRGGALRNRICAQQYTRTHTCVCAYTYSCGAHDRIPLGQNTYAKCIINHTYIHTNWQRRGRKGSGSQRVAATKGVERSGESGVVGGRNVTAVYTASRALRPRSVRIPSLLAILPSCHPAILPLLPLCPLRPDMAGKALNILTSPNTLSENITYRFSQPSEKILKKY